MTAHIGHRYLWTGFHLVSLIWYPNRVSQVPLTQEYSIILFTGPGGSMS